MALRIRYTAPIAFVIALAMTPALSGCFGNPVESIIEGATGGEVDLGGSSMPADFPSDQVPVIDGDIIYGGSIGSGAEKVFNVTVRVSDGAALQQIKDELEAAGFVSQADLGEATNGGTYIASSDAWGVLVVVSENGSDGWVANYTVTAATSG
ncbi:hypothetical protein HDC94_001319 [Leifsonia sp. AK011]|uniref:hypothetical protein n=1 Tax=Leifsonia sp. AK011 TaxID=2723075 RepID=UPI0015C6D1FD|nr:hypothetical protein [Leifsonia sp. AK011]NYF10163.1 hypothetical protein [Leifsonia sp. AK011]